MQHDLRIVQESDSRTLSPDNEGMETSPRSKRKLSAAFAGHSAPTMRGWKPHKPSVSSVEVITRRRTLSPDNEGDGNCWRD